MKHVVKALKTWLETNSPAELAGFLGYRNSQVVTNWVHRQTIPFYQVRRVMEYINGETQTQAPRPGVVKREKSHTQQIKG